MSELMYQRLKENLKTLKMKTTLQTLDNYLERAVKDDLNIVEVLDHIFSEEAMGKRRRAYENQIRMSAFPMKKTLTDFDFSFQPSIDKRQIDELSTIRFLDNAENIVFLGPPGVGKTHLATAIGMVAAQNHFSTFYVNCHNLIEQLKRSHYENRLPEKMKWFGRYKLLIIDEIGYLPMDIQGANLFFQLITKRYEKASTIFTSNKASSQWYEVFADVTIASAILDRVLHHCTVVNIKGESVEVPLDIPGEWEAFAHSNGTIYAVNGSGDTLLKSLDLDKNNWDYFETGHDEQASPAQGGVTGIAVAEDNTLYLSSGWAMRNEEGYSYVERIQGHKAERVQLDQSLDTGSDRLTLCVLPSGELLGLSDMEAYRFSADGTTQQKYAVSGGTSMAVHGNEGAICSTKNSLITVLDIESGQVLRTLPLPSAASYGLINYDAKGALYYVSPDGLYQVNAGDTLMMQIADGKLMSASKPSVVAQALLFDTENNPVIAYSQEGSISLISYRYDENVATEPSALLSVFTLYDSRTLRESANKFQQKYPDAMVDIIVALPQGTAVTRDDAIRTLNTEVLAGRGPDVLVLDGLPVQSYLDKGVLMDLSPMVQPLIDSGELLNSVAGAFKVCDTISAVPTRFLLPSLWGDVEGLKSLEDMAAWAEANPDALPLYAVDVEPLIGTFYPTCAPAWFTEDKRLDEAKIEAFLTALQAIRGQWTYETMVKKTGWDIKAGYKEDGRTFTWYWNPYQTTMPTVDESIGCDRLHEGIQKQLPYLLRGLDSSTEPNGVLTSTKHGGFAPLPGQEEGGFVPMLLLGASKDSSNSDIALAFIEYALGKECQTTDLSEGFQVNVKALDAAQVRDHTLSESIYSGGGWSPAWLEPARQKQLREMIDALTTPVIPDFTLFQMIVKESTPFFEGKIDAKQAAANVCAKANAYLSE